MNYEFLSRIDSFESQFSKNFFSKDKIIVFQLKICNFKKSKKELYFNNQYNVYLNLLREIGIKISSLFKEIEFIFIHGNKFSIVINYKNKIDEYSFFKHNILYLNSYLSSKFTCLIQVLEKDLFFTSKSFELPNEIELKNYLIFKQRQSIHDSLHYWNSVFFPERKSLHSNEILNEVNTFVPCWEEFEHEHERFGSFVIKHIIELPIKDLNEKVIDLLIKNQIEPPETVRRNKSYLKTINFRFEDDKQFLEKILS